MPNKPTGDLDGHFLSVKGCLVLFGKDIKLDAVGRQLEHYLVTAPGTRPGGQRTFAISHRMFCSL